VIADSSRRGVSLKPSASGQGTTTGVPSLARTMSGYDTQYGAGTITSSPVSSVAISARKMTCFAPPPTAIRSAE
jgi:hypothetical protein